MLIRGPKKSASAVAARGMQSRVPECDFLAGQVAPVVQQTIRIEPSLGWMYFQNPALF
jgi:hypothetical protein